MTDPEVIRFANEELRPAADALAQLYYRATALLDYYYASGISTTLGGAEPSDVIEDGAATDGRHAITVADALNLLTRLSEYRDDKIDPNPAKLNTILALAVNPQRR